MKNTRVCRIFSSLSSAFSLNRFSLRGGPSGRRGIALLVVIGLTAMLMLLGAAFAIYMRTERLASGNFKNDVRARQLLHVALARAMDAVETACMNATNAPFPYPPFDVLYSENAGEKVVSPLSDWSGTTNTCWGATNYLPRGAFVTNDFNLVNNNVGWMTLSPGGEDVRYAYVVLNASGLFDANQVGRDGNIRGAGTNIQEIFLDGMPENNSGQIYNFRPFETLPDLITNTIARTNFVVFQPYLRTTNLVDLSGDENALNSVDRHTNIVRALQNCGIINNPESVFQSLLDYVSTNVAPRAFDIPCMKKVPMLNEAEVDVQYWYDNFSVEGQTSLVYTVQVRGESWYPYSTPREDGRSFILDVDVQTRLIEGGENVVSQSEVINFGEPVETAFSPGPGVNAFHSSFDTRNIGEGGGIQQSVDIATLYNMYVRVETKLIMRIRDTYGNVVDVAPFPTNSILDGFVIPEPNFSGGEVQIGVDDPDYFYQEDIYGIECYDPRCNWMRSFGEQWMPYNSIDGGALGSLGPPYINTVTVNYFADHAYYMNDGNINMYAANRGYLESVGELTYLMRSGKPTSTANPPDLWTTIRLVPPPWDNNRIDPIFDHFTIGTNRADGATPSAPAIDWGLVNANSRNPDIWTAVFTDMSLNRPGTGGATAPDPAVLAAAWLDTSDPNNNPLLGKMFNITDFCRAGWTGYGFCSNSVFSGFTPPLTPLEKEAFFINTAGLLGVRQNTFVIMLYAEPTRTIHSGAISKTSPLSGIRAVATVWRDPVSANGEPHRWFVRSFDILKNE